MYKKDHEDKLLKFFLDFIEKKNTLPWESGLISRALDSPSRGAKGLYSGVNIVTTYISRLQNDFDSDTFVTLKEINRRGGKVNKGACGTPIVYPIFKKTYKGKVIPDALAFELIAKGEKCPDTFVGYKAWTVFNLAQTNLPYEKCGEPQKKHKKSKTGEAVIKMYQDCPPIVEDLNITGDGCYVPSLDVIKMGSIGCYKTASSYYATLFHEMIHSTGSDDRLHRSIKNKFGTQAYAKEELIAEIGASILMSWTSLQDNIENHGAYVKGWASKLKDIDNFTTVITSAFNNAIKATDYIEHGKKTEQENVA